VVQLFTTFIAEFATHMPLLRFLEVTGYTIENRGDSSPWCLARKRSDRSVDRYPFVIYGD